MQRAYKALENGTFRKIICGASNTSEVQVERLALVYSMAGVHVIDVAPQENIYNAAKRGIERSPLEPPVIMTSVNVGGDKHFRKASYNLEQCDQCLECAKVCQVGQDQEKCIGCALCVEACQHNAITMVNVAGNAKIQPREAIELHTGDSGIEQVKSFVELNESALSQAQMISVSIDSSRFNHKELIEYAEGVVSMFDKKIIIQADGLSMRGGTTNKASTIQTIAAAATLIDAGVNAYIQLAGGTNHLSQEIVNLTELGISGIGYGTFAKKIILRYIEEYKEEDFLANLDKIVDIARNLIKV